jgi:hypothetical protein
MRITVVSLEDPWERSHGGTLRTRSIVAACRDLGHAVTVVYPGTPSSDAATPDGVTLVPVASRLLGERAVPGALPRIKKAFLPLPTLAGGYTPALARAVEAAGPTDVLCVSQLRAARYLKHAAGAQLWLDQSDLWSEMLAPEIRRRRGLARLAATAQQTNVRRAESRWLTTAGAVTAAGSTDTETIRARSGTITRWLPTPVSAAAAPPPLPAVPAVGLLGNFAFWPNVDAYELLREAWLPALRAQSIPCLVAGYGSEALTPADGIELVGPVASPLDFYARVSATVAPIRLGGGMKVKVAESLVYDRPVIATAEAMEGFDTALRDQLPTVDAAAPDFGELRARLAPDPALFDHARTLFSPTALLRTVEATLEDLAP